MSPGFVPNNVFIFTDFMRLYSIIINDFHMICKYYTKYSSSYLQIIHTKGIIIFEMCCICRNYPNLFSTTGPISPPPKDSRSNMTSI